MRKLFGLVAVAALAVGLSAPAKAAPVIFNATLSVGVGALPPISFTAGGVANVNSTGGFTIPSNVFSGFVDLPNSLFTGVPLISDFKVNITGNAPVVIAPGGLGAVAHPTNLALPATGLGGRAAIGGTALVNVLFLFTLPIPLSKVGSGTTTAVAFGGLQITATATGWTTGAATILNVTTTPTTTTMSNPAGTEMITGTDSRTANHLGMVTIVSPGRAATSAAGNLPLFTSMKITFSAIPEPGTLLLLGSGIAGLAVLGRRRMRS